MNLNKTYKITYALGSAEGIIAMDMVQFGDFQVLTKFMVARKAT